MDTATHALLGALAVQAIPARLDDPALTSGKRMIIAAAAAAVPDLDYLGFWIDPYTFLTQWHRGMSHSLVMLPLWAVLLALLFSAIAGQWTQWRTFLGPCVVGLLTHIAIDLTTVFGVQLFAPFHDDRAALSITFDFDPWITLIAAFGLVAVCYRRSMARWAGVVLLCYLAFHAAMQRSALTVAGQYAATRGISGAVLYALPQPLLPFHWKLVVAEGDHYVVSHLNLLGDVAMPALPAAGGLSSMASAYRSKQRLIWSERSRFGNSSERRALALEVWEQKVFSGFRRFAALPFLYRIDLDNGGTCVWFSDLRYLLPAVQVPFRFGMCRFDAASDWHLYRLRRFSENHRQWLGR
jgi:inner membrane protein